MDNQNQEHLRAQAAIEKLRDLAKGANICMFHTNVKHYPDHCRPMAIQTVEDDGSLWYLTSSESSVFEDIQKEKSVMLTFQNNGSYEYLVVYGDATLHDDKQLIDKYWTDFANAWFDGKDDPKIRVVGVHPTGGYYWDTKNGKIISSLKMLFSIVTGADSDGGVEGELDI